MVKLSSQEESTYKSVLLYGPPFTGKTLLAGKLAEHFNIILIDLENGHDVLFQLPKEWQERIELINIPDTRSYPMAIETCLKIVKGKAVNICEEHGKVGCMLCKREEKNFVDIELNHLPDPDNTIVIFDSGTQLTNSAIAHITKKEDDDYKLQTDDWGHLGKLMDIFYSHLQQGNYHRIVISHEIIAETPGKKDILVPIAGSRNFSRNVAKYFDHVIYAERKNKKHVFASSTQYATNILTGSRTGVSMEDSDEPSLLSIFRPELYPASTNSSTNSGKSTTTTIAEGRDTKSILARLKKQR